MNPGLMRRFRFGVFEVDTGSGDLWKHGVHIKLHDKPFQVLQTLLERPGETVTRRELQARLWPGDTFVEFENGLNNAISRLRETLGDSADSPRFIETVPRRGYRFIAPVEAAEPPIAFQELPAEPKQVAQAPQSGRLWLLALSLLVLGPLTFIGYRWLHSVPPSLNSVVVLPLVSMNVAEGSEDEYLAFGMTEALTAELSKISALKVISQTSAMQYKGARKSLPQIARELGVAAVVEGSVVREGNEIRVTVQLIEATTDSHLWASTYHREMRNILSLQAEIARAIAREVRVKLSPQEQASANSPRTVDPLAHEAYLRGLYLVWQWRPAERDRCVEYFEKAIAIDPDFAQPYAGLARYYAMNDRFQPKESMPKAKMYALKALQLDERLPDGHYALATELMFGEWDWIAAEREFQRTLELDPGHGGALRNYSFLLGVLGRHQEAEVLITRAKQSGPLEPGVYGIAGRVAFLARNLDRAIEEARSAIALEPRLVGREDLAVYLAHSGRHAEAIAQLDTLVAATQRHPLSVSLLAGVKALSGEKAEARKLLQEVNGMAAKQYVPPTWLVLAYLGLGDHNRALDLLDKAYEERDSYLLWLTSPLTDPLRGNPRFLSLLKRMDLPRASQ
jgi:TolB-like protein/DNA-binding winged helix-turn-helix (wHTH) protein/Tfp pilus assembly protein PilF